MKFIKNISLLVAAAALLCSSALAQSTGSIGGQVIDSLGAVVVGASVSAVSADGKEVKAVTNAKGEYTIPSLAPGIYTVKVAAAKFAPFENPGVEVKAGERNEQIIAVTVTGVEAKVDVNTDNTVDTDPSNNAGATVIKDKDLDALPDDPDDLASALQALAGPAAGPNGGQIYIDGFQGGNLPPKESIREIRINQNPFSAEYDRLGFGRIEILTKPGSDKFRGSAFFNFNDESLNSRNPFSVNRAPSQTRYFGGNFSGPIIKGKASFFVDAQSRDIDNNSIVNAIILDPALNPINFTQDYRKPTRRFSISPRIDYAINDKNTLVVRYSYDRTKLDNQGIGDLSLISRASNTTSSGQDIRITETAILNAKSVNETRFGYSVDNRDQNGDNSIPTISVASAFTGGGASVGNSFNHDRSFELSNFTTTSFGKSNQHSVKFGGRIHGVWINDQAESNYAGTYSFQGVQEVRSPANCDLTDPSCTIVTPGLSPIDQYRGNLLGLSGQQYLPTRFSLTTGDPLAKVSQVDVGIFATDDWRINPGLLLSFGLRYENQTNINSKFNFAPRFGFAYSPGAGGSKTPKTVIRGGAGVFYDRFSENYTLAANRFDGITQLNLVVNSQDLDASYRSAAQALLAQPVFSLSGVANSLTAAEILTVLPGASTTQLIAKDLNAPYLFQEAIGVERQMPWKTTVAVYYIGSQMFDQLRTVNINAPVCALITNCVGALRPDMSHRDIMQYESNGRGRQNQINFNFRNNYSSRFSIFGNYSISWQNNNTDGANSSPLYSYDFSTEWGRGSGDIRHRFVVGGNIGMPWSISLSPFVVATSGRPFNIVTGQDTNGDGLFTERPTFGVLGSRCSELGLNYDWCNVSGHDPNAIIPRNYAEGPGTLSVNLRLSKNFGFGKSADSGAGAGSGGGRGKRGGGGMGGGMMGGGRGGRGGMGGGGFFGGASSRKPYNLNLGINFTNLLNTVNFGNPVSNLSSSRFGQYTNIAGGFGGFGQSGSANRRIELQARFSW